MRVTLTVTAGPNLGQTYVFEHHDVFLVGRSANVHFALPDDPYFSRVHFMLEINPPLCRIADMKSRNGTLVNDQRLVEPRDLRDGDEIGGGKTRLRVHLDMPDKQATPTLCLAEEARGNQAAEKEQTAGWTKRSPESFPVVAATPRALEETTDPLSTVPSAGSGIGPVSPGQAVIPGYRILAKLGEGGMGMVFKARRESDGSLAAIKVIRPNVVADEVTLNRFLREAKILQQLQHAYIVPFLEMGHVGEDLFFVMHYVEGQNLFEIRKAHLDPFPIGRAVRLMCQVLEALAYAHECGFVHRDIKPSNIMATTGNEGESVRVIDFGLARTYQASALSGLTMTGAAGGTAAYMPPEQATDFRNVKPAADQYSTAATLYYLLTGQNIYPRAKTQMELLLQILQNGRPTRIEMIRTDLPPALAQAIGKALNREPEDRFASVSQFHQALLPFARS